jgi:hypothetical protein
VTLADKERTTIMIDEIFDRSYRAARGNLNASVGAAFAGISQTIGDSLKMLHRIEWNAPWARAKKKVRRA